MMITPIADCRLPIAEGHGGLEAQPGESAGGGCGTGEATALGDIGAILGDTDLDLSADSAVRIAATWLAVEPPQVVELQANLLSTLSYSMANNGQEPDAVLLARSAALAGASHVSPLGGALLWDRVAWAHARGGDERACRRALDAADQAFSRSPGDDVPEWAYWLDRRELDVMAGRCLTQLDHPEQAEPLLLGAIAGYDATHSREVALYRTWLAEAYAKRGDVEAACAETMAVLDTVEAVNSARVDDRVAVLRRVLCRYADSPAVRDVEERSRALLRSA